MYICMPELKTLKDIQWRQVTHNNKLGSPTGDVSFEILKEEAIKWIKELEKGCGQIYNTDYYDKVCEKNDLCEDCIPKIDWIKHFFNIEDSDLE